MKLSEIAETGRVSYPCVLRVSKGCTRFGNTLWRAEGSFCILGAPPKEGSTIIWIKCKDMRGVRLASWNWNSSCAGNPETEVEVVDLSTIKVPE